MSGIVLKRPNRASRDVPRDDGDTYTPHRKVTTLTAPIDEEWKDPATGEVGEPRRMSRFKRRRLGYDRNTVPLHSKEERRKWREALHLQLRAEATGRTAKAERQLEEAADVTRETKRKLKRAAEGES